MSSSLSRRSFLKKSLAASGLTLAVSVTPFGYKLLNASEKSKEDLASFKPNVWFEITPENEVIITVGNSEMGQGVLTALPMIVADELEADWKQVKVRQGPALKEFINPLLHLQLTVASASVRGFYDILRKLGATGRAMLIQSAAGEWNVPANECVAEMGTVKHKKSGKKFTYGELCLSACTIKIPKDAPLKKESEFRYIGKSMDRVDIPEKVSGKAVFGLDSSVKGMLYGVIARPPAYGAKPVSFDQKAAESVKGVAAVIPAPQGVIVCADSTYTAMRGRAALNVKWDKGALPEMHNEHIEKSFMAALDKPGSTVRKEGDAAKAVGAADKKVSATYFLPYVAHTTMEPMNCTAHVQKDRVDVWAPTQGQTVAQMVAGQVAGMPPEKVFVHTTLLGCGLGRRAAPDFVVDAVVASKVTGKPVKIMWTREEDVKYDQFRAATCQRLEAGLDGNGKLTGWSHKVVTPSILKLIAPDAVKNGIDFYSLWGLADFPGSPHNNNIMYKFPNTYIEFLIQDELPIPVAPWRSVQNAPNAFVIESFMDELAHAAGKDPLEFRLQSLKGNMRPQRALKTAAEKADWGKPLPAGKGRGIAQHSCFGTYVAQVAEVTVNDDGTYTVDRVVAAVDCGPVVNPGPLVAQIEGAITMGLSTVLKEEVMFEKGGVKSSNFDDYDIIRMSDLPEIEVHIIKSTDKLGGIGEPGVPPLAPAVANAIFNACGARVRRLPITAELVMAAVKEKKA